MLRLLDTKLPILMDRDEGCSVPSMFPPCSGEYSLDQLQIQKTPKSSTETMDNMEHNPMGNALLDMFVSSSQSLDKLSFADVMNFADYGSKVTLHQQEADEQNEAIARGSEQHGFDPIFFLKFPVLASDHKADEDEKPLDELASEQVAQMTSEGTCRGANDSGNDITHELNLSSNFSVDTLGSKPQNEVDTVAPMKQKRKRTRAVKNSEEVESQRMTHIAVERNRRKQMNEHLRVLRSLMPGSYVQRGDQASIIGGAIEFVRELEQLLQCLESQKRRRLYAEATTLQGTCRPPPVQADPSSVTACVGAVPVSYPVFPVNSGDLKYLETGNLYDPSVMREDVADNKSPVADVEVKLLGYDAMIKILSQRRPGQLLKTILALETQLQFTIMHTNVTTIEQTVLYSFNVKVGGECKLSAEDIANSVQQIFNMIHASCMGYIKD